MGTCRLHSSQMKLQQVAFGGVEQDQQSRVNHSSYGAWLLTSNALANVPWKRLDTWLLSTRVFWNGPWEALRPDCSSFVEGAWHVSQIEEASGLVSKHKRSLECSLCEALRPGCRCFVEASAADAEMSQKSHLSSRGAVCWTWRSPNVQLIAL